MDEKVTLIKQMIIRAREVAVDRGVCEEAEIIIDQMEMEFLGHVHPGKDAAQEYMSRFTEDQASDWDSEDVMHRLRQAFMAGWDAREEKLASDASTVSEGTGTRVFTIASAPSKGVCLHESYTETGGWRKCSECHYGWAA